MRVVVFLEYTEGKNKYWISLIDRGQTVISTFVNIDNVIAVFRFCIAHIFQRRKHGIFLEKKFLLYSGRRILIVDVLWVASFKSTA